MNPEEELQQKIEQGKLQNPEKDDGVAAYLTVFKALKSVPDYLPSRDLADNVIRRLEKKQHVKLSLISNDYFWFGLGLLILLASAVVMILLTKFEMDFGFLNSMSAYRGLLIFGVVFIALLNWIDKRLIGNKRVVI